MQWHYLICCISKETPLKEILQKWETLDNLMQQDATLYKISHNSCNYVKL